MAAEKLPAGQEEQVAVPGFGAKVPEVQLEHTETSDPPELGLKRPASQRVHCWAYSKEKDPGPQDRHAAGSMG